MFKQLLQMVTSVYFVTTLLFSNLSVAQDWEWIGFEVIGNHKVTRTEILARLPITIGDIYKEDPASWQKWCADLKSHFKFHFAQCSAVRYINFQACRKPIEASQ